MDRPLSVALEEPLWRRDEILQEQMLKVVRVHFYTETRAWRYWNNTTDTDVVAIKTGAREVRVRVPWGTTLARVDPLVMLTDAWRQAIELHWWQLAHERGGFC